MNKLLLLINFKLKTMKKLFLILISISIGFYACKKNDDGPIIYAPYITNVTLDFFKDNLNDGKQITAVDISSEAWILGNKGTQIYIYPCSFLDADGNTVTGIIDFELIEAQTNLDMLKINRPTFTKDGQLLVSGGIVYVNATQNGNPLQINPNCGLQASIPEVIGSNLQMQYFRGSEDENNVFSWEESAEDTVTTNIVWDSTGGQGQQWTTYGFSMDSIGWINCDYFYNTQSELTGVQIELSNGYNGSNSQSFIYYSSINSLAGLNDNDQDGVFDLGGGYETPIGMNVKFVVLSEDSNGDYYYHITSNTTITMNHYEIIPNMIGPISHSDLEVILNNNLP